MAKKTKSTVVEDESVSSMDFDQADGGNKVGANDKTVVYFLISMFVTSLPVYLYYSVFDLSFESFGVVYLPVSILSSLLLTFAYRNWACSTYAVLSNYRKQVGNTNHKKLGLTKAELDVVTDQITVQESIVWSLFISNIMFFLTFMFVAFYALKAIASPYQYTLAMTISSAVVWQMSSTMTKEAAN